MTTNGAPTEQSPCPACAQIDAKTSAICVTHRRAFLGPDAPADVAELIQTLARKNGITVKGADGEISVDVEVVEGARVVRIVLPVGGQSVALRLPPAIAKNLAACIQAAAKDALVPMGLVIPPR